MALVQGAETKLKKYSVQWWWSLYKVHKCKPLMDQVVMAIQTIVVKG